MPLVSLAAELLHVLLRAILDEIHPELYRLRAVEDPLRDLLLQILLDRLTPLSVELAVVLDVELQLPNLIGAAQVGSTSPPAAAQAGVAVAEREIGAGSESPHRERETEEAFHRFPTRTHAARAFRLAAESEVSVPLLCNTRWPGDPTQVLHSQRPDTGRTRAPHVPISKCCESRGRSELCQRFIVVSGGLPTATRLWSCPPHAPGGAVA